MSAFLDGESGGPAALRQLLTRDEPVVAPGAYDALSARLIEAAGFSAVHMTGFGTAASLLGRPDVGLLGSAEMVDNARRTDMVLIARTDARAVEGLEAALARARQYRDAGADVIFFEAPQSLAEVERVARELSGVPLLFNWAEGGKTPPIGYARLRELGFRIIIFPISALLAATRGIQSVLDIIRRDGAPTAALDGLPRFGDFLDFIGLPEIRELEQRFS